MNPLLRISSLLLTLPALASAALEEAGSGKVLFHCTVAWRASHLWAAYLVEHKKLPVVEAIGMARRSTSCGSTAGAPMEDFLGRRIPELRAGN